MNTDGLTEIPISELRLSDVGSRVVVARDGNTFDGMLTDIRITRNEYRIKDTPRTTAHLTVKTLQEATEGVGIQKDSITSKLELSSLPLDYRIQIQNNETKENH